MNKLKKFLFTTRYSNKTVNSSSIVEELSTVLAQWKKEDIEREQDYCKKREELYKEFKKDVARGYEQNYTIWITNRFISLEENFTRINDHRFELIKEIESMKN